MFWTGDPYATCTAMTGLAMSCDVQFCTQALEEAGCFAILMECLPPLVAAALTKELSVPTIGIGAGPHCSGQVTCLTYLQWTCKLSNLPAVNMSTDSPT